MDEYHQKQFEFLDENNEFMNIDQEQQRKIEGELERCEIYQQKYHIERIGKHRQLSEKTQKLKDKNLQNKLDIKEKQVDNKIVNNISNSKN